MFPTAGEYNQTIQSKGAGAFGTLSNLSFVPSRTVPLKIYSFGTGSYAVVFKATDQQKQYAIRCFISAEQENIDRYRGIHEYLKRVESPWVTHLELLENEITVGSKQYPVIKMDWIEGKQFNNYISSVLNDNAALSDLQEQIIAVSKSLESSQIGHGDIQCGNMIVTSSFNGKPILKLIDYDGMYIPSFAHKANLERGRSEFQHPQRHRQAYNEKIDRFSFWVILCALEALKHDKTLWLEVMQGGFNTLDNVLFTGDDLKLFNHSRLVNRLYALQKPVLSFYLDKLNKFCNSSPNEVESPVLFSNPEPVLVVPKQNEPSSGDEILISAFISSNPVCAPVLMADFRRIGFTPLRINKSQYLNKTLIVSYGTQYKQVQISNQDFDINLNFSEVANQTIPNTIPPPSPPVQRQQPVVQSTPVSITKKKRIIQGFT